MDWGRRGSSRAAERGDILVIVDVLSFSSLVATALQSGVLIYPCKQSDDPAEKAKQIEGEAAVRRAEVPEKGRFSLSPLTYLNVKSDTKVVVASPNGATCCQFARQAPHIFVAGLLNAKAVAGAVSNLMQNSDNSVTVIACGEREKGPDDDGPIRWAVEDYLGAGAVLYYLTAEKSPDAIVCENAFLSCRDRIGDIHWKCPSGIELREIGFGQDVKHSARLNIYDCIPELREDFFGNYSIM